MSFIELLAARSLDVKGVIIKISDLYLYLNLSVSVSVYLSVYLCRVCVSVSMSVTFSFATRDEYEHCQ